MVRAGLAVALCVAACGGRMPEAPVPEIEGGWQLGLSRYSSWSHVRIKPPYLIGPDLSLRLEQGRLHGNLGGRLADVRITSERATGWVAGRPVELAIEHAPGEILVEGLWSGATARLTASDTAIRALIPVLRNGEAACCADWKLDRQTDDGKSPGFNVYLAAPPHPTHAARLELPQILLRWYTSSELALVLIALMTV